MQVFCDFILSPEMFSAYFGFNSIQKKSYCMVQKVLSRRIDGIYFYLIVSVLYKCILKFQAVKEFIRF